MIRVYYADVTPLENEKLFSFYYENTSPFRREKIDRLRPDKDKRLSLGASVLIGHGLKPYGITESDMTYGLSEYGKPFFDGLPSVHFSISHSGNIALAVFSDRWVGCDIEKIKEFDHRLSERFFTSKEAEEINKYDSPEKKTELFFRYWVLKESFIKAVGRGFSLPLDSFSFSLSDEGVSLSHPFGEQSFSFIEKNLPYGYRAAVCYAGKDKECKWEEIFLNKKPSEY